jgi:hypothetical protein
MRHLIKTAQSEVLVQSHQSMKRTISYSMQTAITWEGDKMDTIPTRKDIADQLRDLIEGRKTREEVSAWACKYALDDDLVISDRAVQRALMTLVGADARADLERYLYFEVDFKKWLDDLLTGNMN